MFFLAWSTFLRHFLRDIYKSVIYATTSLACKKDLAHARYVFVGLSIIFYVTAGPIHAITEIDIKKMTWVAVECLHGDHLQKTIVDLHRFT